jgi:hypothetical protein
VVVESHGSHWSPTLQDVGRRLPRTSNQRTGLSADFDFFLQRLEQSEAVERLERFEPNPGWLARGISFLEYLIRDQKRGAKPPQDVIYAIFCR